MIKYNFVVAKETIKGFDKGQIYLSTPVDNWNTRIYNNNNNGIVFGVPSKCAMWTTADFYNSHFSDIGIIGFAKNKKEIKDIQNKLTKEREQDE